MFRIFKKNTSNVVDVNESVVTKVINRINRLSDYGSNLETLNEYERIVYLNTMFQTKIAAGGFAMVCIQTNGNEVLAMVDSLKAMDAVRCAQFLQEALTLLPIDFMVLNVIERQKRWEEIDSSNTMFLDLNEAYQAMGENLDVYIKAYVLKHQANLIN